MKKRRLISVLLCISLFFAGGCGQKTAEKQPATQETAEQTAKETHKAERENKQETVQENTPADEQEEAAAETGAATVLPDGQRGRGHGRAADAAAPKGRPGL